MTLYLKLTGRPVLDRSGLSEADLLAEKHLSLWAATAPWTLLVVFCLLVNIPALGLFEWTFNRWSMPVEIIPKAPEKIRLLWQAYFWILVSTLLALPLLRPSREQLRTSLSKWTRRAPRPMLAAAIFFAIAFIFNHSGKGLDWTLADPRHNMVHVLATASAGLFGRLYPLVAPFLGLLGGFISGSEASSIAMLTRLHLQTAERIGAVGLIVAAASGIGGGLASVISPAKLQNAAASIDRIGEEASVIPVAFTISIAITTVCAVLALFWAF
jgi:lactate permease